MTVKSPVNPDMLRSRPTARCVRVRQALAQPEMFLIRGEALVHRAGPAEQLKPVRDFGVIQVGMVAAVGADELEAFGVAAFHPTLHDTERLAPEARGGAMAGLARSGNTRNGSSIDTGLRSSGTARAVPDRRTGGGTSRFAAIRDDQIFAAHSCPQARSSIVIARGVRGSGQRDNNHPAAAALDRQGDIGDMQCCKRWQVKPAAPVPGRLEAGVSRPA